MLNSGDQSMRRQSSRNTANMDTIDCNVPNDDLAIDDEVLKRDDEYSRSNSRRDQPSKRSNDNSTRRPNRHSPPSVTRKYHHQPSHSPHSSSSSASARPPSYSSSTSSRPHHYLPQRHRRDSSRSISPLPPPPPPPPPPPVAHSSSRHHRPTRPAVSAKRPYPQSESPHDRYHPPPSYRSRLGTPTERATANAMPAQEEPRAPPKQETTDLSLISEDESTKPRDNRSTSAKPNESSSTSTNNNQLHSTPSVPSNSNASLLEMSIIPSEPELSLFARSALSSTSTSSILTPAQNPMNNLMQAMDLLTRYTTMPVPSSANPQIDACSKEILNLIQRQIQLEKIKLTCCEREIKLREQELAEREQRFKMKPSETNITMASANSEPLLIIKPNIIEDNTSGKAEIPTNSDIVAVSPDESVPKSIPPTVDTPKVKSTAKTTSDQAAVARKTRFSQPFVDPSIFSSQPKPVVELYSDVLNVPDQSIPPTLGTDLKITSSSNCRKVEIQSGNAEKSGSKESPGDLRLTLGKIRTKQHSTEEYNTNDELTINDLEPTTSKTNENKQQSHDYQQQRSFTSTSIEPIIDESNEKRDVRRHRQQPPQQQQSYSSSNSNERSYTHGSTSKYGSNPKRYENNNDLRTRIFDHKYPPKPSRTTHKNNNY